MTPSHFEPLTGAAAECPIVPPSRGNPIRAVRVVPVDYSPGRRDFIHFAYTRQIGWETILDASALTEGPGIRREPAKIDRKS